MNSSTKPPAGRPPAPDGSLPAHGYWPPTTTVPTTNTTTDAECYPSGAGMAALLDRVRGVIRAEWVRVRGGVPIDQNLEMRLLNELMTAFATGKVIPGYRKDASGQCQMNWAELACFGRWYAILNDDQRAWTLDSFSDGFREPWAQPGEYPWPPAPSPCTQASAEAEAEWCSQYADGGKCTQSWCCPDSVYGDPAYVQGGSSSASNTKWLAMGIGGLALAGLLAVVIFETKPSSRAVAAR